MLPVNNCDAAREGAAKEGEAPQDGGSYRLWVPKNRGEVQERLLGKCFHFCRACPHALSHKTWLAFECMDLEESTRLSHLFATNLSHFSQDSCTCARNHTFKPGGGIVGTQRGKTYRQVENKLAIAAPFLYHLQTDFLPAT